MPLLLGIVDPDPTRRREVASRAGVSIAAFGLPRSGVWTHANVTIVWAAADTTPVAWSAGACTRGDDVETEAIFDLGDPELDYHLRCRVAAHGSVMLSTDPLGYFPLYHAARPDRLLFSTAPGLIRDVADQSFDPSPTGIAGLLLAGNMLGGQTIWKGIRRLAPFQSLHCSAEVGVETRQEGGMPVSDRYFGASDEECLDVIDATLEQAIGRRVRDRPVSLMLSGGLDSRILAGYLHAGGARDTRAVTFGRRTDYEAIYAALTAWSLGWSLTRPREHPDRYPAFASRTVELEQMATTLGDMFFTASCDELGRLGRPVMAGLVGNVVTFDGDAVRRVFDPVTNAYPFERAFALETRFGLAPEVVRSLMRTDFAGDAVSEVVEAQRSAYENLPGEPFQRVWHFSLQTRQRFHVAPLAWRLAFSAWPLLPYCDRDLIQVMGGMPLRFHSGRALQRRLLVRRFPRLARLPLDTNTPVPDLILDNRVGRLAIQVATSRFFDWLAGRQAERRFYRRSFAPDGPGWMGVRLLAEPGRTELESILEPQELRRLLPPPHVRLGFAFPIPQGGCMRTLLGLMLSGVGTAYRDARYPPSVQPFR
jgi:asparagine synthase (glutamine-hydrolysing)